MQTPKIKTSHRVQNNKNVVPHVRQMRNWHMFYGCFVSFFSSFISFSVHCIFICLFIHFIRISTPYYYCVRFGSRKRLACKYVCVCWPRATAYYYYCYEPMRYEESFFFGLVLTEARMMRLRLFGFFFFLN